jgi:hypothetical protein
MLVGSVWPMPVSISLGVIAVVLVVTVALSLRASGREAMQSVPAPEQR